MNRKKRRGREYANEVEEERERTTRKGEGERVVMRERGEERSEF